MHTYISLHSENQIDKLLAVCIVGEMVWTNQFRSFIWGTSGTVKRAQTGSKDQIGTWMELMDTSY